VELPVDTPVPAPSRPKPQDGRAGANAVAFVILYSLALAAGGGYVFYASIRPVSIPTGYGVPFTDFPWLLAFLVLAALWLVGPVALLIAGLIHLRQYARHQWWSALAWVGVLAAGAAIGYVIMRDCRLLFSSYPRDLDGSPLGPSRFAPGRPYWRALIAAGGQLAAGAVMIALITASARPPGLRARPTGSSLPDRPAGGIASLRRPARRRAVRLGSRGPAERAEGIGQVREGGTGQRSPQQAVELSVEDRRGDTQEFHALGGQLHDR